MEELILDEPDPLTTTASEDRTYQRENRELLDAWPARFKSSDRVSNFPIHYPGNRAPSRGNGILNEVNFHPSYVNPEPAQYTNVFFEPPGFSFSRTNFHGISPTTSRLPREFAQASWQTLDDFIERETQPNRTDSFPSGHWKDAESHELISELCPVSPHNGHHDVIPDQNVAGQSSGAMTNHGHNPLNQPYVSGMQTHEDSEALAGNQQRHIEAEESMPFYQGWQESHMSGEVPEVKDPIGEEHTYQQTSYQVHGPTITYYPLMDGTVETGAYGATNQGREIHTQYQPCTGYFYVSPVLASLDRMGYVPPSENGSSPVDASFQDGIPVSRIPNNWPNNVMPTDNPEEQNRNLETSPFLRPDFNWGGKRNAEASSPKPVQESVLATRPSSAPSSCWIPVAGSPIFQQALPPVPGVAHDSTARETRPVRGLENDEIPQPLQIVFDSKTGEKPNLKSRRRASSQQRRNTQLMRRLKACDDCRMGKRRCEHKLREEDKVTQSTRVEKSKRGRNRKQRAPRYCTPAKRRQSEFSLAISITSSSSFSAESAGDSEVSQHISPVMEDLATPPESPDDDNVEDVTRSVEDIGAQGMRMSASDVQEPIQVPSGMRVGPQLPFRPATSEGGQTSTQPLLPNHQWDPEIFGSTPDMYQQWLAYQYQQSHAQSNDTTGRQS